jgi:hypothetical protein
MSQVVSLDRIVVQHILPSQKMSPFMTLYGYHPPSISSPLRGKVKVQAAEDHVEHQQEVLQLLKDELAITQNRMKQQAYQHHSEMHLDGVSTSGASDAHVSCQTATSSCSKWKSMWEHGSGFQMQCEDDEGVK